MPDVCRNPGAIAPAGGSVVAASEMLSPGVRVVGGVRVAADTVTETMTEIDVGVQKLKWKPVSRTATMKVSTPPVPANAASAV